MRRKQNSFAHVLIALIGLSGCSGSGQSPSSSSHKAPLDRSDQQRRSFGSLLEDGGWNPFGGKKGTSDETPTANPYLWRAGLESLQFLPLASADVRGGVVVSDWYTFPDRPNDRFKVSLFVKSRELKAEALEVTVHRQRGTQGPIVRDEAKAKEIEELIVQRARSIYIDSKGQKS